MSERYTKDVVAEETREETPSHVPEPGEGGMCIPTCPAPPPHVTSKTDTLRIFHDDPMRSIREMTKELDESNRSMKAGIDRANAEDEHLESTKAPCPNCGLPLVTEDNHRVRLGRGVLQIGRAIEVRVNKNPDAVFDGCVECLTRPALHWSSMTERVYEVEAAKGEMQEKIDGLERRLTTAVGTLYLRWWVVGLAILAFEVFHFICYLCVKHFAV